MSRFLYKTLSVLLAGLVWMSTLSFTIEKHYCGRFLVDVSIVTPAKDCGMLLAQHNSDTTVQKMPCCKDELTIIQGQDELKNTLAYCIHKVSVAATIPTSTGITFLEVAEPQEVVYTTYAPPDIGIDIPIFYQTFLI